MNQGAFQDYYPDELSHCYGCGRLNEEGLQLKSHWDDEETVAIFTPRPYHTASPGFVYGGLIASLIDCHGHGYGCGREISSGRARYAYRTLLTLRDGVIAG